MFKIIVFIVFNVAASSAAPGPPGGQTGTSCGITPNKILQCLNSPSIISRDVSAKCREANECDKLTCIFRENQWLSGASVDRTKLSSFFDQFAKDHPEWLPAVTHLKLACLSPELKTQGVHLNCPAYDVTHCAITSFIKHATPSQWSTSEACSYPRQYAAACPVCPDDCFSLAIPSGSCNACISLPRSP